MLSVCDEAGAALRDPPHPLDAALHTHTHANTHTHTHTHTQAEDDMAWARAGTQNDPAFSVCVCVCVCVPTQLNEVPYKHLAYATHSDVRPIRHLLHTQHLLEQLRAHTEQKHAGAQVTHHIYAL